MAKSNKSSKAVKVSTNPAAQAAIDPVHAGAVPAPAPEAAPAAPASQELVKVHYHVDNHHVLDGVHAVRKGLNHLPKHVWEKAKAHPSVAKLIEQGHLVEESPELEPAAPAVDAAADVAEGEGDSAPADQASADQGDEKAE